MRQRAKWKGRNILAFIGAAVLSLSVIGAGTTYAHAADASEKEPNDEVSGATVISVNQKVSGVISDEDDVDWYKFTITDPGALTVNFAREGETTQAVWWNVYLYAEDGTRTCYINSSFDAQNTKPSSPTVNVAAGTYYVKILSDYTYACNVEYGFTVKYESAVGTNIEREDNDTAATANSIEVNRSYYGRLSLKSPYETIASSRDVDWYQVTVSEPGALAIEYTHDATASESPYWHGWAVSLFGDKEESVRYLELQVDDGEEATVSSESVNVPAGTYYIKVSRATEGVTDTRYGLKMNFTPAAGTNMEQESNDGMDAANAIEVNADYRGRISLETDIDWYTFELTRPSDISVVLSHQIIDRNAQYWNVHIYGDNTSDEYMDLYWSAFTESETSSTAPRLAEGRYYVSVSPVKELFAGTHWSNVEYTININATPVALDCDWIKRGEKYYWYEGGVRQGTMSDANGVMGTDPETGVATNRGREIYDAGSDGWYWLDSIYDGAKAIGKEVWMPYVYQNESEWDEETMRKIAYESDPGMGECVLQAMLSHTGKWVRYDENGAMLKGWVTIKGELATLYPKQAGNIYYYDNRTGLMAKGEVTIDGKTYYFDEVTGVLQ